MGAALLLVRHLIWCAYQIRYFAGARADPLGTSRDLMRSVGAAKYRPGDKDAWADGNCGVCQALARPASGLPALTRPLSLLVVVDMPAQGRTPAQVPLQRSPINLCAVVPAAGERCHALELGRLCPIGTKANGDRDQRAPIVGDAVLQVFRQ
jgi:hypothetical protein